MKRKFAPIDQKSSEIIEYLMEYPELPDSVEVQMKIRLCIEEAVVNITQYAYENPEEGWLEASIDLIGDSIVIQLVDAGVRFNPLAKEDPDISLSAEEREIGGLGIFLCKTIMDDVRYSYVDNCNVLTMKMVLS